MRVPKDLSFRTIAESLPLDFTVRTIDVTTQQDGPFLSPGMPLCANWLGYLEGWGSKSISTSTESSQF